MSRKSTNLAVDLRRDGLGCSFRKRWNFDSLGLWPGMICQRTALTDLAQFTGSRPRRAPGVGKDALLSEGG
jgi:hypothetical protein